MSQVRQDSDVGGDYQHREDKANYGTGIIRSFKTVTGNMKLDGELEVGLGWADGRSISGSF